MRRPRIVVLGFGPFPGVRVNPSGELALRLGRSKRLKRAGLAITSAMLATRYDEIGARLSSLIADADVVLMTGVAARARWLRVEERGVNHVSHTTPDAGRHAGVTRVAGAPFARRTTVSVMPLVATLRRNRLPASRSIDAGRYLCNAGYYAALTQARPGAIVLFVHVPLAAAPPGTVPRARGRPRPGLGAMERALTAVIADLARAARQRHG